jgi:hypothetical protein
MASRAFHTCRPVPPQLRPVCIYIPLHLGRSFTKHYSDIHTVSPHRQMPRNVMTTSLVPLFPLLFALTRLSPGVAFVPATPSPSPRILSSTPHPPTIPTPRPATSTAVSAFLNDDSRFGPSSLTPSPRPSPPQRRITRRWPQRIWWSRTGSFRPRC